MPTVDEKPLTQQEQKAIDDLKALARRWPKTLWLFSCSGTLTVMRTGDNGEQVILPNDSIDEAYEVEIIQGIMNDGGDY